MTRPPSAAGIRVVGAGLPRTGTSSLRAALEELLGGPCCHMSALEGHPFNLGPGWDGALAGKDSDWNSILAGYVAAVDWPASAFWRELSEAYPEALVLLSVRKSAQEWWESLSATILPYVRMASALTSVRSPQRISTAGKGENSRSHARMMGRNWSQRINCGQEVFAIRFLSPAKYRISERLLSREYAKGWTRRIDF